MFRKWCATQKFTHSANLSHVLMDGGVLSIPFDRLSEFYDKYVKSVCDGEQVFVVEQKTDIYNFFVDLDYKDSIQLSLEMVEKIIRIICDKVHSLGGGNCLISISKPKKSGDLIKSGIHMNWPDFPVDQKNAIYLRQHIINVLTKIYNEDDWEKIVDIAVYGNLEKETKGSGFRMPWSHKRSKHVDCGGSGCITCENNGKITEAPYLPIFLFNCEGPFKLLENIDYNEPSTKVLFLATIRTTGKISRIIDKPDNTPIIKKEGKFTNEQVKNEINDNEVIGLLEIYIRTNLLGQAKIKITKLFKSDDVYLVSTDSSYCENLGKSHSSNHIWFLINHSKISQKCFCTCDVIRKKGFCKNFEGTPHELSPSIVKLLYPVTTPNFIFTNVTQSHKKNLKKPNKKDEEYDNPEANNLLEKYIQLNLPGQLNTKITKILKGRDIFSIFVDSKQCEKCDDGFFLIENFKITKTCSCKNFNRRSNELSPSIVKILYPIKKSDKVKLAISPNVYVHSFSSNSFCNIHLPKT